jgi:hypothetical protein
VRRFLFRPLQVQYDEKREQTKSVPGHSETSVDGSVVQISFFRGDEALPVGAGPRREKNEI